MSNKIILVKNGLTHFSYRKETAQLDLRIQRLGIRKIVMREPGMTLTE